MAEFVPYRDLLERADVLELAERLFSDGTPPDFTHKFLAMTMMCLGAEPETPVGPIGYAATSACVFYAPAQDPDSRQHGAYEPWTFQVGLGASAWFTFTKVDDSTQLFNEDDGPEEDWQAGTLALLQESVWMPVRDAATLGR